MLARCERTCFQDGVLMSLAHLFASDDKIFICDIDDHGTKNEFVGDVFAVEQAMQNKSRNFFAINPVKGQRRLKSEVKKYQSFLFESDSTPLEIQFQLLPTIMELGIVRMATYSGGKSIHLIVSVSDDLLLGDEGSDEANDRYKNIWLGLARILSDVGLDLSDASNKNPVTLSRIPGQYRAETEQKLLAVGNFVESAFLHSIAVSPVTKPMSLSAASQVTNIKELETRLSQPEHGRLALYLKYPSWIQNENGNYPTILRIALWALDEVGATPETFTAYFEKYTVPHLHAHAYFKDWRKPLDHAYRMKGMLWAL